MIKPHRSTTGLPSFPLALGLAALAAACSVDNGPPLTPIFGTDGSVPGPDAPITSQSDGTIVVPVDMGMMTTTDAAMQVVDTMPPAVICTTDNDCTAMGKVCNRDTRACVTCTANIHCKGGQRCAANVCETIIPCKNSLACTTAAGGNKVCNQVSEQCVQCNTRADCPVSNDCTGGRCTPFTSCKTSLDCPLGQTCDPNVERCFECVRDADCGGGGKKCIGNICRTSCQSDNQCVASGLLCDISNGHCATCFKHEDCPLEQHCATGSCKPDVCTPGGANCSGNSVQACNAAGSGYAAPSACGGRQTCVASAGRATCNNWICTAGKTECNSNGVVVCSADGLREVSRTDCGSQTCVAGKCQDLLCVPNQRHCYMGHVETCSADGISRSRTQTCTANQYCNDTGTATCSTRLCTPGQPACNGNAKTTCNDTGSGFMGSSIDCGNFTCVAGSCVNALVDTIAYPPGTPTFTNSAFYGNIIVISQSRTLSIFEAYTGATSSVNANLKVFELVSGSSWNLIFSKAVTVTQAALMYYSSGQIAVPLVAGKTYAIGIDGDGANTINQPWTSNSLPTQLSWGQISSWGYTATEGSSVTMTPSTASGATFSHRYTTGVP